MVDAAHEKITGEVFVRKHFRAMIVRASIPASLGDIEIREPSEQDAGSGTAKLKITPSLAVPPLLVVPYNVLPLKSSCLVFAPTLSPVLHP